MSACALNDSFLKLEIIADDKRSYDPAKL